jgi:hypothetical protein
MALDIAQSAVITVGEYAQKKESLLMRIIMLAGFIVTFGLFTPLASAQQQTQKKAEKAAARCTPQACQKRGLKMGYNASTAASWCAAHNNGC